MRLLMNLAALAFPLVLVSGCSDGTAATSPEHPAGPLTTLSGQALDSNAGAIADPDCILDRGSVFTVPVPVSETDVWITQVRMKEVHCLTRPDGSRLFQITHEVVGDIPMPGRNVTIHGMDEAGNPKPYNVILDGELLFTDSFACFWTEPPFVETYDWEFHLTPGGVNKAFCRYPAPGA